MSENDTQEQIQTTGQTETASTDLAASTQTMIIAPNKSDAQITVSDPITKEEKFGAKHTVYTIKGYDKDGFFEVVRRYSDFERIRNVLVTRWPGIFIPSLPPKKTVNNMDVKFIEERRKALDYFCRNISELSYLHYSEEFQLFIRSSNQDMEKALAPFLKTAYGDIIAKYLKTFDHLSSKEINNETNSKINNFKLFLTKIKGYFENFKKISRAMAGAKKNYYEQLALFNEMTCVPYEKSVFSEYHGNKTEKNVFYAPDNTNLNKNAAKLKENGTRDSYEAFHDYIDLESREIDAFLDTISQREKYDQMRAKSDSKRRSEAEDLQKIIAGKKTMKTLFSNKSKDQEISTIEKNINDAAKGFEDLSALYDMITVILAYDEIERYKSNKVAGYFRMLGKVSDNEMASLKNIDEYWNIIKSNDNIKNIQIDA